jgi:hypothetical protein
MVAAFRPAKTHLQLMGLATESFFIFQRILFRLLSFEGTIKRQFYDGNVQQIRKEIDDAVDAKNGDGFFVVS